MCDAFGLLDLKYVTLQISLLADAMVQVCLQIVCRNSGLATPPICVLALGKHGGEELNYSSDIDLILIAREAGTPAQRIARRLIDAIGSQLPTGFLYRVDMRLRPWGEAGPLVVTPASYESYLKEDALLWEKQSLLKARVIAGDSKTGEAFLKRLPQLLFTESEDTILRRVRQMKGNIEEQLRKSGRLEQEVKLGSGSIRDIEFLTQALQLIHGRSEARLICANTLDALIRLAESGVLDVSEYHQLREGYVFFRTIEHALQLLHNQQTHELPTDPAQCFWLARRLDFQDDKQLLTRFDEHRQAVRRIFNRHFLAELPPESPSARTNDKQPDGESLSASEALKFDALSGYTDTVREITSQVATETTCVATGHAEDHGPGEMTILVATAEKPAILSVICGVLFAAELDIKEGMAFNGITAAAAGLGLSEGRALCALRLDDGSRRSVSPAQLARTTDLIQKEVTRVLELQQLSGHEVAREHLVEMFCERLRQISDSGTDATADINVRVLNDESREYTRLQIEGDDSVGFFFEVCNALSICGFRIHAARLEMTGQRIHDELQISEESGGPVVVKERIEELRTAVTLIKQFTRWLPTNSDPHWALLRFRDLLQSLLRGTEWQSAAKALRQPKVLRAISRVLGMSRYLWEDFLQSRPDELIPLLSAPERLENIVQQEDLEKELNSRMNGVADPASARQILNSFKDHHLFRVDLRHVLGYCRPFGVFSEEVTGLADLVISAASRQAVHELRAVHGYPRLEDGRECGFTLLALGKFGGSEMGFGSDIEFFLVYEKECRTDRSRQLSAGSFFERVVSRIQDLIETRRRGIFEVDLRMRPYGQAGSPAIPLPTFQSYYGTGGDAWPYERQSLVRARGIAGDADFRERVESVARELVYSPREFNFDAMRALREKQIRQLVRGGTVNAKLSSGGLVDCEYSVQAIQMTFGADVQPLQTTNTMQALNEARQHDLISEDTYREVTSAYRLLRELIDCLRMVRGSAEDLTIPAGGTADYAGLARRMQIVHEVAIQPDELGRAMETVRAFSLSVEQICRTNSHDAQS